MRGSKAMHKITNFLFVGCVYAHMSTAENRSACCTDHSKIPCSKVAADTRVHRRETDACEGFLLGNRACMGVVKHAVSCALSCVKFAAAMWLKCCVLCDCIEAKAISF